MSADAQLTSMQTLQKKVREKQFISPLRGGGAILNNVSFKEENFTNQKFNVDIIKIIIWKAQGVPQ